MNTPATQVNGSKPAKLPTAEAIEKVLIGGDLKQLSEEARLTYYNQLCETLGLNPLTRPFEYIVLSGKLTLYARKDCTEQLRKLYRISLDVVSKEQVGDLFVVTARASLSDGRRDEDIGALDIKNLRGDDLANAMMKAVTKAKRRVTLSICGLGFTDESELETIPGARPLTERELAKQTPAPASPKVDKPDSFVARVVRPMEQEEAAHKAVVPTEIEVAPEPAQTLQGEIEGAAEHRLQSNMRIKGENLHGHRLSDIDIGVLSWWRKTDTQWGRLTDADRDAILTYLEAMESSQEEYA